MKYTRTQCKKKYNIEDEVKVHLTEQQNEMEINERKGKEIRKKTTQIRICENKTQRNREKL